MKFFSFELASDILGIIRKIHALRNVRGIHSQATVAEDFCSQPSTSFQGFLGTLRDDPVHPKAGTRLFGSEKSNALQFKFNPDQRIQIQVRRDYISSEVR